eukprot:1345312-Amorphochlora_amoeboformis.AAC.2
MADMRVHYQKGIVEQNKLARNRDTFDFCIKNSQTGSVYPRDSDMVPKNTSLIVRREPSSRSWDFMLPGHK